MKQTAFNRSEYQLMYEMFTRPDIILMQFTGLKDRNNTPIYEGDIVQWHNTEGANREIIWPINYNDSKACFMHGPIPLHQVFDSGYYQPDRGKSGLEVLGNIYQNPELVKNTWQEELHG